MADAKPGQPEAGKSYVIGDVGAAARVAQGETISWIEGVSSLPGGEALARQFSDLLKRISEHPGLDKDSREITAAKTQAIADGLAKADTSPGALRRALIDAKSWFDGAASWVGDAVGAILKSEAAQKTIKTVTDAGVQAAIKSFTGGA